MDVERKELSFKANPSMCGKRRTEESKTRRSAYNSRASIRKDLL